MSDSVAGYLNPIIIPIWYIGLKALLALPATFTVLISSTNYKHRTWAHYIFIGISSHLNLGSWSYLSNSMTMWSGWIILYVSATKRAFRSDTWASKVAAISRRSPVAHNCGFLLQSAGCGGYIRGWTQDEQWEGAEERTVYYYFLCWGECGWM